MTDMTMPQMTDRAALARNRSRAEGDALFLHAHAAAEIKERLTEVNRTFQSIAIVTGFPDFWASEFPEATIVPDTDALDLHAGAHDLVLHMMCLHWASDPVGQLVQCRRALQPDGLFMGCFLGGQTLHELRAVMAEAEARVTGGLSPRIAPMGEIRDLGGLLQRAGYALPVADGTMLQASYATPFDLMRDLRRMGEANALSDRIRHLTRRAVMAEAATIYADSFGDADGRVNATFELISLTGWAPSDNQPQPLRPGSATTRLAAVLGTVETTLDPSKD